MDIGHAMHPMAKNFGFTLIELIVVVTIIGIVSAMVAVFMRTPVQAYISTASRAELVDRADTALRRMTREIHLALPNSIRTTTDANGNHFIEFLLTRTGGRYRHDIRATGAPGDPLNFGSADTSFDTIGTLPTLSEQVISPGADWLVLYNLSANPAITQNNAYAGDNRALITGVSPPSGPVNHITFASKTFLSATDSPQHRFYVVSNPVSYECDLLNKRLIRYSGYTINLPQPIAPVNFVGGQASLLAEGVIECAMTYRLGLFSAALRMSSSENMAESVRLYEEVQVSNAP